MGAGVLDHHPTVDVELVLRVGQERLLREPFRSVEGRKALIEGMGQVDDVGEAARLSRRGGRRRGEHGGGEGGDSDDRNPP